MQTRYVNCEKDYLHNEYKVYYTYPYWILAKSKGDALEVIGLETDIEKNEEFELDIVDYEKLKELKYFPDNYDSKVNMSFLSKYNTDITTENLGSRIFAMDASEL